MSKIKETAVTTYTRACSSDHPDVRDYLTAAGFTGLVPPLIRYSSELAALMVPVESGREFATHTVPLDGSEAHTLGDGTNGSVRLATESGLLFVVRDLIDGLILLGQMQKTKKRASVWCVPDGMDQLKLPRVQGHIVVCSDQTDAEAGAVLLARAIDLGWTGEVLTLPEGQGWAEFVFGGNQ